MAAVIAALDGFPHDVLHLVLARVGLREATLALPVNRRISEVATAARSTLLADALESLANAAGEDTPVDCENASTSTSTSIEMAARELATEHVESD